jgi:hypothetical protein
VQEQTRMMLVVWIMAIPAIVGFVAVLVGAG